MNKDAYLYFIYNLLIISYRPQWGLFCLLSTTDSMLCLGDYDSDMDVHQYTQYLYKILTDQHSIERQILAYSLGILHQQPTLLLIPAINSTLLSCRMPSISMSSYHRKSLCLLLIVMCIMLNECPPTQTSPCNYQRKASQLNNH